MIFIVNSALLAQVQDMIVSSKVLLYNSTYEHQSISGRKWHDITSQTLFHRRVKCTEYTSLNRASYLMSSSAMSLSPCLKNLEKLGKDAQTIKKRRCFSEWYPVARWGSKEQPELLPITYNLRQSSLNEKHTSLSNGESSVIGLQHYLNSPPSLRAEQTNFYTRLLKQIERKREE